MKADRLAERLGLGELYIKNETANPTHSFKDRVVSVALARAVELGFDTLACASTGNLANAVAAHAAAAGLPAYVLIPHDLEEQKVLATGAYGAQIVAVKGNYDDVNRLCTEVCGERPGWAFVNINMRPYYAEGSKTLAFETVEQLGWELPDRDRRPDRLRLAVHQDRARLPGVHRRRPRRRRAADDERRPGAGCSPVATAFAAGHDIVPAGQAGHDRQVAGDRQPRRRPVRDRARPRAPAAAIDSVDDDEIRAGIRLLAETTGIFTETAGGVTIATLAKLAERGDIGRDERVVAMVTGDGLKTIDAVRDTFRSRDPGLAGRVRRALRAGGASDGGHGQAARPSCATPPAAPPRRQVDGGTVGEALEAPLRAARRAARADRRRRRRAAPLRQRLSQGRGHPLPRRARTPPVADGDEVTILPAVAGG